MNKEDPVNETENDLPKTLGLGALDKATYKKLSYGFIAEYRQGKDLLYRVSLSGPTFKIVEFFDGKEIATTIGTKSLGDVFCRHLASDPPYQSKRFERIYHQMTDGRNVNVRFATESKYIYYPAGYIFFLRQPVIEENKAVFEKLENRLSETNFPDFKLEDKKEGVILKLTRDATVSVEPVTVANFSCLLYSLVEVVDLLWKKGLVPGLKEYRLNVLDSSLSSEENITIYFGDLKRNFVTYALFINDGTSKQLEEAKKVFNESSFKFLQSQRK